MWACLQGVTDPELDESVVDLNFIARADVDSTNRVHIEFRLPTYWCAANFSFLMADDMHRAVSALDWVEGVSVVLGEHMYADKINEGLAKGLSFQEAFGAEADGSLDDLRQTFLVKAFQRRQVALLNHPRRHRPSAPKPSSRSRSRNLAAFRSITTAKNWCGAILNGGRLLGRLRPMRWPLSTPRARDQADGFATYVSRLRRVGVNAEFNGALCRGLLSVRFDLETPFVPRARASPASEVAEHKC